MKTFQQFNEDAASQYRSGQLAYQSSAPARLAARRSDASERSATVASDFAQTSKDRMAAQKERQSQIRQGYEERQHELKAKREAERQARREREDQQEELQLEQDPHMTPTPFNIMKAREQAKGGIANRRHIHGELAREAGAEQAAKKARIKAIMSR